jgi:predicted alpha/beta hydrolase family esterase
VNPRCVLTLPGWQGSGPAHWQSRWEELYCYARVEQHDWQRPLRGDWMVRLEEALLACDEPAVLVAHSLGCLHVAAWASHSRNTHRVRAALLVAPPDTEREDLRALLPSWSPVPLPRLPFPARVLVSSNDPFGALERTRQFAAAWGAELIEVGDCGHLNADSALGDWPQGHGHLLQLINATAALPSQAA